jgi:hypothetical protein
MSARVIDFDFELDQNSDGKLAHTHPIAIGQAATRNVHALALTSPTEKVIPLVVVPLLVGIVRGASPDLEFRPVLVHTILDVQTFVAEGTNGATGEGPLLRSGAGAGLDGDLGAIRVGGGGQAFIWGRKGMVR